MPPRRSRCWCSRRCSLRAHTSSRRSTATGSCLPDNPAGMCPTAGSSGRTRATRSRMSWWWCGSGRCGGRSRWGGDATPWGDRPTGTTGSGMCPTAGMSGRTRATRSRMSWWWCGSGRCGGRSRWGGDATPWGDRPTGTTGSGMCPTAGMSGRTRATRSRMSWWWCGPGMCGCRCRWGASATPWGDRPTGTTAPAGRVRCWCGHKSSWSVGNHGGALTTCCQKSTAAGRWPRHSPCQFSTPAPPGTPGTCRLTTGRAGNDSTPTPPSTGPRASSPRFQPPPKAEG